MKTDLSSLKPSNPVATLVFIDAGVKNYQQLVDGVIPKAEVFVLDAAADGVEQISHVLQQRQNVGAVHIVSHGAPGGLYLGNTRLSLDTFRHYATQLQKWKVVNLFLYGCNVAAGDAGEEFIEKLHQQTGASIAASRRVIGDGYWFLDVNPTGTTAQTPFDEAVLESWTGRLALNISNLSNSSYTEQDPAIILDSDISFSGGTNYSSGYLEFSLSTATASDFLSLVADDNISTANNQISIVANTVYLGDGSEAAVVGTVDSTFDGQNGKNLRINLSTSFPNGNFNIGSPEDTTITSWTTVNQQVKFGNDTIANLTTPTDSTIPSDSNGDQNTPSSPGTMTTVLDATQNDGGGNSLRLASTGITTAEGYDIVRGPYVYSDTAISLSSGDQVSFEWQAQGGGDAYDIYGYIVDINNNHIETILDETGSSESAATTWATETITVSQAGEYKFVFVAGTYDYSGGKAAGAQLYIDDVTVTQSVPSAVFDDTHVSALAQRVQYNNTSDSPETSKTLTVSVQNSADEIVSDTATIDITLVNDAPTALSLSSTSINENSAAGSAIGTFSSTDPDASETFTYTLVAGTGDTDNSAFTIDSDQLKIIDSPDYEAKDSYSIHVRTTDSENEIYEEAFTINVNDFNKTPTAIALDNNRVNENQNSRTLVGTLSTIDADDGDTHIYQLVGGEEDTDNSAFTIDGNQLKTNTRLNYEAKSSYSIRIQTTDSESETYEKTFTISVNNLNEIPRLSLINTNTSLAEDIDTSTRIKVADIRIYDDGLGAETIALSGPNADLFELDGRKLFLKADTPLNHETEAELNVQVSVNDSTIGSTPDDTESLAIAISDVNEAPSLSFTNSTASLAEDTDTSTRIKVADIVISDDALGNNTLSLSGEDAESFEIDDSALFLKANTPLDFETHPELSVSLSIDDATLGDGAEATESYTLNLIDMPDDGLEGDISLFWSNRATGENQLWLFTGLQRQSVVLPLTDTDWQLRDVGDFNGDDQYDLLWRHSATGENAVWLMNGTDFIQRSSLRSASNLDWSLVGAADFNGDDKDDLLWRHAATGKNAVWLMDGTTFMSSSSLPEFSGADWSAVV
ncbi:MAG: DUF4347 domain-containing protein [Cyanophyceae cyanobacterium]